MGKYFASGSKKLLFFDWNQTLVDTHSAFDQAFLEVLKPYLGRWDNGMNIDLKKALIRYKEEWNQQRYAANKKSFEERFEASLRAALSFFPLNVDRSFAIKFQNELKKEKTRNYRLMPGVRATLEKLARKYQLAIISNGGGIDLKQANLEDLIDPFHCFTSSEIGRRKPSKVIFAHALAHLGKKPSECVMVGNSWRRDIQGAAKAGMDSVWIVRKQGQRKPQQRYVGGRKVVIIRRFSQLLDLF